MRHNVRYSIYATVVTALVVAALLGIFAYCLDKANPWAFGIWGVVVAGMAASSLAYAPLSLSVDDVKLTVRRPLRAKEIPLADIRSVKFCPPTMGALRICGSGGFFGYWGWFSERDLGRYFAYYGKASDCFLVTLKDGRKYMLGCERPQDLVAHVEKRLAPE